MDIQTTADSLRDKAAQRKKDEQEELTKDRMKKVLTPRDEAMKRVAEYQAKTGEPNDDEINDAFFASEK